MAKTLSRSSVVKRGCLHVSKWFGLFGLARRLTTDRLRILGYHGFALKDECAFRPQLFIERVTFERRLKYLAQHHFPVLDLGEAVERLQRGTLPPGAVAITIDDGFYGTYVHALPLLKRHAFPATVYVTTYYAVKETPVFRLAVQYLFWKTQQHVADLGGLGVESLGQVDLREQRSREQVMWHIIDYGEAQSGETSRQRICAILGDRLGLDYNRIVGERVLDLMRQPEIRAVAGEGMDVQLHTHRHRFPTDGEAAANELRENRAILEPLAGKTLAHFCYPSGIWSTAHWPILAGAGVTTATTCLPGLNTSDTPSLGLLRFLDSERITQIEFEAEMSGYAELLRHARSRLRRFLRRPAPQQRPAIERRSAPISLASRRSAILRNERASPARSR